MQDEKKKRNLVRDTYSAGKHLPADVAKKVLDATQQFIEVMSTQKVTTHPAVRRMLLGVEQGASEIKTEMLADSLVGGKDEMDNWAENGMYAPGYDKDGKLD